MSNLTDSVKARNYARTHARDVRSVNGLLVRCERCLTELNRTELERVRTFTANIRDSFYAVQFSSDDRYVIRWDRMSDVNDL